VRIPRGRAFRTYAYDWPKLGIRCSVPIAEELSLAKASIVCIIHTMQSRELIKLLQADGWRLRRTRGSHHQFVHPTKVGTITVPHPKKDLGKGLVLAILKQAGLK
jgi:predicted RNA binding protein YcfA (HicA-like mRNA interferase family)